MKPARSMQSLSGQNEKRPATPALAAVRPWFGVCLAGMLAMVSGVVTAQEAGPSFGAATDEDQVAQQPGELLPADDVNKIRCPTREDLKKRMRNITQIPITDLPIEAGGKIFPVDCARELIEEEGNPQSTLADMRHWPEGTFSWKASGAVHRPLYTEDVVLERYGHTSAIPGLQPVVSGVRFYTQIAMLPYQMAVDPPRECIYTLGYYRPGDCAPFLRQRFPPSLAGAAAEVGSVAFFVLLIP